MVDESFKPLHDKDQKASKDILTILENIQQMFICYRHCVNESAACAVLMGLGIEAQTLALKLHAMYVRWQTYIPFHEAMDINFIEKAEEIERYIQIMQDMPVEFARSEYRQFTPCEEYLFDLYAMNMNAEIQTETLQRNTEDNSQEANIEQETKQYVKLVKSMIHGIQARDDYYWLNEACDIASAELRDKVISEFNHIATIHDNIYDQAQSNIVACFNSLNNYNGYCRCSINALTELKNTLLQLAGYFKLRFTNDMFVRFSRRIYFHLCQKHYGMASDQVSIWQNSWPEEDQQTCAVEEKKNIIETLLSRHYGKELARYIKIETPNVISDPAFGRFLNKNREKLSRDDVREIHYYCRIISLLNQIIGIDTTKETSEKKPALTPTQTSILNKINTMHVHGECVWQNITADDFLKAIRQALGVGKPLLDNSLKDMSAKLWQLFIHRERCDRHGEDISFMVTWLNIIGYAMRKGYITGGAPSLASHFFPKCEEKDYNFITKANKANYAQKFKEILPLLDYCLEGRR